MKRGELVEKLKELQLLRKYSCNSIDTVGEVFVNYLQHGER